MRCNTHLVYVVGMVARRLEKNIFRYVTETFGDFFILILLKFSTRHIHF